MLELESFGEHGSPGECQDKFGEEKMSEAHDHELWSKCLADHAKTSPGVAESIFAVANCNAVFGCCVRRVRLRAGRFVRLG